MWKFCEGMYYNNCIGYHKKMINNSLEGLNVRYYYNPFFDVTNSIDSLWFVKK